jgi:hypothetical protein
MRYALFYPCKFVHAGVTLLRMGTKSRAVPPAAAAKKALQAKTISLRLQGQQLADLDGVAERAGTTRSALIQLAIARLLEKGL